MAVVERFNCSIFLTFKPTTVHCGDNLLGNRTSNYDESSAESESDEEDVELSSGDEHDSDQGQREFQNTSILSFVKNSVISWSVCRLANPQKAKNVRVWTWAGKGGEKCVKCREMSQIMGIGKHISLKNWGSKHHDQFYHLGFVILYVLLAAILRETAFHLVAAASSGRLEECNQTRPQSVLFGLNWPSINM